MSKYFLTLQQLKAEETQLKAQLSELNKEYDKLDARVGLLGHKSLLADYSKTLKHLDNVRKGVKGKSINDDPIQDDGENSNEEEKLVRNKKGKAWNGNRQSRKQENAVGCGIGSGESEISSPNERDNESSN